MNYQDDYDDDYDDIIMYDDYCEGCIEDDCDCCEFEEEEEV